MSPSNKEKQFKLADGFAYQRQHMKQWQSILKPEKYEKLSVLIQQENYKLTENNTGYDVVRGNGIDNIVANELMER